MSIELKNNRVQQNFKIKSFLLPLFDMFALGQKLIECGLI